MSYKIIAVVGPTAVGKSDVGVRLAQLFDGEIINGDSIQVYRELNIGSAKITEEEMGGIVHHLLDYKNVGDEYSVQHFQHDARKKIGEIEERGHLPVVVGGTGLYIKALLEGYEFNETADHSDYRQELTALAEEKGRDYIHGLLQKADPEAAERIHANNLRRVIRALEVAHFGGEQISQQKEYSEGDLAYDVYVIGLNRERQGLYQRINERVEMMFAAGLEAEVKTLLAGGVTRDMQAMQGIGYKETAAYLAGEMTRAEAVDLIQKSTRHFAKRQLTWFRKMPYIHWYMADEMTSENLLQSVCHDLAGFFPELAN